MIGAPGGGRRAAPREPIGRVDRRRKAWVLTGLATAASTYALDAFAVAVGASLASSGALAGLDRPLLLSFLALTYVVWGAGMRVNLAANWALLTCTGASTNALSKAAYDIARARSAGSRTPRRAASGAYLFTEAAKELPYYASAFGAVVVTDAVSAGDAIIFLAGTNIGAAIYEYGVARATLLFLRPRVDIEAQPAAASGGGLRHGPGGHNRPRQSP